MARIVGITIQPETHQQSRTRLAVGNDTGIVGLNRGHHEFVHHLDFAATQQSLIRFFQGRFGLRYFYPLFRLAQTGFDIPDTLEILVQLVCI